MIMKADCQVKDRYTLAQYELILYKYLHGNEKIKKITLDNVSHYYNVLR